MGEWPGGVWQLAKVDPPHRELEIILRRKSRGSSRPEGGRIRESGCSFSEFVLDFWIFSFSGFHAAIFAYREK